MNVMNRQEFVTLLVSKLGDFAGGVCRYGCTSKYSMNAGQDLFDFLVDLGLMGDLENLDLSSYEELLLASSFLLHRKWKRAERIVSEILEPSFYNDPEFSEMEASLAEMLRCFCSQIEFEDEIKDHPFKDILEKIVEIQNIRYSDYYKWKEKLPELNDCAKDLFTMILKYGTPRELLLGSIIAADAIISADHLFYRF